MERVNLVGVELEGGWNAPFPEEDSTEIYSDHSVHLVGFDHVGEVSSKPLSLEEVLEWTEKHYPQGSDGTCGIHVHVSLKSEVDYAKLCRTPHFFMQFLQWGKEFCDSLPEGRDRSAFFHRISGGNRFCALKFIPEKQLALFRKGVGNNVDVNARYAVLNFSRNVHGTLENRVFPVFSDKKLALRGIKEYVELVERFVLNRKEEKKVVRISR